MQDLPAFRMPYCAALLLIGTLLSAAPARAEPCNLSLITELPLEGNDIGSPVVKILVDGQPRRMLLDTGGVWSLIDPGIAGTYRHEKAPMGVRLGLGGILLDTIVHIPSVQLGIVKFPQHEFFILPSEYGSGIDGTLGADWLQGFDLELDPAKNMARLFVKNKCEQAAIYWPHEDAAEIPIHIDREKHITIPVVLNGQEIDALIDTGSSDTVMSMRTAERLFDLTPQSPGMQEIDSRTNRFGSTRTEYGYQFKSLTMGDIGFANPRIVLTPSSGGADMILGMHHLHGLHLYFAYGQHKLYVTSARGDIAAQKEAGGATPASVATGADPVGRINARNFIADATVALKKQDRTAAAAAIDKALVQDPSYPEVYLTRAKLRFEQGDRSGAMADMAEALKRAPDDMSVLSARASVYAKAGEYELAYADIDKVLRLNPPSAAALNGRCWFGAHLDKYEAALADCEAALKLDPHSPSALDSRGYVYLKTARPDLAIAEYNKAIKANRDLASPYYGRALAEAQKGDKSDSADDMATARKIDPDIDEHFGK